MLTDRNKIVFTTACVAKPGAEARRMIHWLEDSCKRFNVPLRPYGISPNAVYRGWTDIKIDQFCDAAREFQREGYTHLFYTDGRDSFMLTDVDEVIEKYAAFGCPPYIISTEDQSYPFPELAEHFPDPGHPWRYLGAGQFIGEISYMLDMWAKLRKLYGNIPRENHDQGWLQLGYVEGALDHDEFILDQGCVIFQCASADRLGGDIPTHIQRGRLDVRNGRIYNLITKTYPCAIHFPGGYADPVEGKDKCLRQPWAQLGWEPSE